MENYFNYFTEVEECFRRCRSTPTLLSPLDWALIESWKEAGIPLEAVLIGIERAFAKFQKRPQRIRKVNSVAYCTQQVLLAAEEMKAAEAGAATVSTPGKTQPAAPPVADQEIRQYLVRNADRIDQAARAAQDANQTVLADDLDRAGTALREAAVSLGSKEDQTLEELERQLSAVEDMLNASLQRASDVELLTRLRGEMERGMNPYKRNMTAAQIESLERQLLKKRLFEHYQVPRLSLFYL